MKSRIPYQDALYRLAQIGDTHGMQLVRIVEPAGGNCYQVQAIEFAAGGATQIADDRVFEVVNLSEPSGDDGGVPAGTEAVALDVEGRWVTFVRPAVSASFPAKVLSALGGATYSVLEQQITSSGDFVDKAGAAAVGARNLAELSLGSGAAVDAGAIVLVAAMISDGSPPTVKYVFDHPAYAKYLD